ncbi:MAG: ParA family protein, partial [Planctomycetota bacterium]
VDMDPQANLSVHYGVELDRGEPSVYTYLAGETDAKKSIASTEVDGLYLLPSTIDLAGLEVELNDEEDRELLLRQKLKPLQKYCDYILIDCPPSLGMLTLNALCAAKEAFIPLQTEFFALQGVGRIMETVRLISSGPNPELEITGIIPCMFDVRTSLAVDVLEEIQDHFGDTVFDTVIRNNIRVAEAPGYGKPITLYEKNCYGTEDYRSLAREVVAMEGKDEHIAATDDTAPPLPEREKTED